MPIEYTQILNRLVPTRISQSRKTGHFPCIKYHLAKLILAQHQFPDIDSLIEFCNKPENLETWLPSPADRQLISADLTGTLREATFGRF